MKRKGQVNWADLTCLMIVFCSTVMGAAFGAKDAKSMATTALWVVCGGLSGFVVGFAGALVSGRLAYSVLNSKRLGVVIQVVSYLLLPLPFMIGTPMLAGWLVWSLKQLF